MSMRVIRGTVRIMLILLVICSVGTLKTIILAIRVIRITMSMLIRVKSRKRKQYNFLSSRITKIIIVKAW